MQRPRVQSSSEVKRYVNNFLHRPPVISSSTISAPLAKQHKMNNSENIPRPKVRRIEPVPSAKTHDPQPRPGTVPTRIVLISDTHNVPLFNTNDSNHPYRKPLPAAEVLIHAGDLTNHGSRREHEVTLKVLIEARAELKLVIAGNHDITLDEQYYKRNCYHGSEAEQRVALQRADETLFQAREIWTGQRAQDADIVFLDEGVHNFELKNGAKFTVYASPYTPEFCDWAFAYPRTEDRFNPPLSNSSNSTRREQEQGPAAKNPIPSFPEVDILVTHGPPYGILDWTNSGDIVGCEALWRAVQRVRPRLHVFGHIHEAWGGERVDWVEGKSTWVDIHKEDQTTVERGWVGFNGTGASKQTESEQMGESTRPVVESEGEALRWGEETLFVNAAIMNANFRPMNAPWIVDILLPSQA